MRPASLSRSSIPNHQRPALRVELSVRKALHDHFGANAGRVSHGHCDHWSIAHRVSFDRVHFPRQARKNSRQRSKRFRPAKSSGLGQHRQLSAPAGCHREGQPRFHLANQPQSLHAPCSNTARAVSPPVATSAPTLSANGFASRSQSAGEQWPDWRLKPNFRVRKNRHIAARTECLVQLQPIFLPPPRLRHRSAKPQAESSSQSYRIWMPAPESARAQPPNRCPPQTAQAPRLVGAICSCHRCAQPIPPPVAGAGKSRRSSPHRAAPKRHRRLGNPAQVIVCLRIAHQHIGLLRRCLHRLAEAPPHRHEPTPDASSAGRSRLSRIMAAMSERAGACSFVVVARIPPASCRLTELPPIDVVRPVAGNAGARTATIRSSAPAKARRTSRVAANSSPTLPRIVESSFL